MNKYNIIIFDSNKKIDGYFIKTKDNQEVFRKQFNPLTILGDLLNTVGCKKQTKYIQDSYFFKQDYKKHIFFSEENLQRKIECGFPRPNGFELFYNSIDQLKEIFVSTKNVSLSHFEVLKQFYKVTFTNKIEFQRENPLYNQHELIKKYPWLKNDPNSNYQWETLDYIENWNVKDIFEENKDISLVFTYVCQSLEDVIFSVLHYLLVREFRFRKCDHCNNYFAYKVKTRYCNRNSPYKGRENLTCGIAVERIIAKTDKRRDKKIKPYLYNYYKHNASDFLFEYSEQKSKIKSVENLKELERITSKEYVKEKWYKDENSNLKKGVGNMSKYAKDPKIEK